VCLTLAGTDDAVAYADGLAVGEVLSGPFTQSGVRVGLEVCHDWGVAKVEDAIGE
jgi:hypothetical protein